MAIARALVNSPPLLRADEPTGSLDSRTGKEIMALFAELNHNGQTIIMVTHNGDNARLAHRVIRMRDGRIEFAPPVGSPVSSLSSTRSLARSPHE